MKLRKRTRHAGIIEISTEFLLQILDLQGGEVLDIHMQDNYLPHKTIYMVVEHPDFPEVKGGEPLSHVILVHQTTCGDSGVPIKIERVEPPKRNGGKK